MFKNRIRLPFYLSKPQFPVERSVFRKADGSSQLLSAIIRNTYEGKTDQLPEDWHRKLIIALAHDEVTIEDNRLLTDVVLDGDYSIDWQDFLSYPIAQAIFTIQTTPFNATNNNCQSCAEITQMNLVDDYLGGTLEEGNAYSTPSILDNDYICCFPYTVEIMSFNTLYFDYVIYEGDGVLSIIVKAVVPTLNNVLIATYRVTCPNGAYDEANVYGNTVGTGVGCDAPYNFSNSRIATEGLVISVEWELSPIPAAGYNYWVYKCDDIYTVIESGVTAPFNNNVYLTELEYDECYVFAIQSNCDGGGTSEIVTYTFYTPSSNPETCGQFSVGNIGTGMQTASYMDCGGAIQNLTFPGAGGFVNKCMLINAGDTVPIFFAASSPDIVITYSTLC